MRKPKLMLDGETSRCPPKLSFIAPRSEHRMALNAGILGEIGIRNGILEISALAVGIPAEWMRIHRGTALSALAIWWATVGNGRQRGSRRFADLSRFPFIPAIQQ